ncbi:MAG: GH92 family glycosyl hydrolase [Dysgonamonadaceae bacterium]|jgi:predicted alpha-1,2-mannosidase|nr:GH92 family glycosyl hydrolase [Dysgonamonadaceae bacterium]
MKPVFIIAFLLLTLSLSAGPNNIAIHAKVTASSEKSETYAATKIIDGLIGIEDRGEWASVSGSTSWGEIDYPWIQLEWDREYAVDRILLYDRASHNSHTAGGTLHFSDGSKISVFAIPNNGLAKSINFPAKKIKWVKWEVTDGHGYNLGLSEIEVFPSVEDVPDVISKVDPYIESARGRYIFFITGNQPFGMIGAAPMTRNKNQYGGGYNYNSTEVLGFPQVHGWMLSGITFMPTAGRTLNPSLGEQHWKSTFSHDGELVQPGYHRLFLNDDHIWVEQTATERVSFYRLRYTQDAISNILLNLGGYVCTSTMTDAQLQKVSDTELEGSVNTTGRFWGGPDNIRIFFVMKFNKPFEQLNGWDEKSTFEHVTSLQGKPDLFPFNEGESYAAAPTTGVSAVYHVKAGDEIQVKFAVSLTSIDNARRNMIAECDHWDFDTVRKASQQAWDEYLGRIRVKGGTNAQQIKFYTDLWHVLMGRHKIDDVSGDYPDYTQGERVGAVTKNAVLKVRTLPRNADGSVKFHMYNSDGIWLTQWNLNVLWGLAWPEINDDLSSCFIQYAENGKLLPRGPNAGGYSYIMTSCPATNLITSTYMKGYLRGKTADQAFRVMKANHEPGGMLGMLRPDENVRFYIDKGYYPGNAGITLEAAFQDWSLAQMALKMGKKKEAAYYLKRSQGWTQLFHPIHKLILPKDAEGNWLHEDLFSSRGWVEANAWQATWSVSHAIPQLAALMGGKDSLCNKLNTIFELSRPSDYVYGYGNGYISYANQPGCSDAHVFSYAGKPWLTQYWVRQVKKYAYGAITPDKGYGGHDEDQGQMGGISALMAIGLFNVQGTNALEPAYDITSPIFDEITIKLSPKFHQGEQFVIKTLHNSEENCYIQHVKFNGEAHQDFQIKHADYVKGGLLEIELGPAPNENWGVRPALLP